MIETHWERAMALRMEQSLEPQRAMQGVVPCLYGGRNSSPSGGMKLFFFCREECCVAFVCAQSLAARVSFEPRRPNALN